MKRMLLTGLAACGMLFTGIGAQAQGRYREFREPLAQVRADLDRAARNMRYLSREDQRRFTRAHREIAEFDRKFERGRFDRRELNDVIDSLQAVLAGNRLHPRDRDLLASDLNRLRDIRTRYR